MIFKMPNTIRVSGWYGEIPDCWRIEYNNFPDEIFRVSHLKTFDKLFKAVSSTGYTMTVDWVSPKSENGEFIFKVVSGEGFKKRQYVIDVIKPRWLASKIERFGNALCSEEHQKLWLYGGKFPIVPGSKELIDFNPSNPVYYEFKNRYFRVEGEKVIVYDVKTGRELFRKKPGDCQITKIYVDPLNRGFLLFFDITQNYMLPSYRDTKETENKDGIDYVGIVPPQPRKVKRHHKYLGLFDENLDVVWWAENFIHKGMNMTYYTILEQTKNHIWVLSYHGYNVKINLENGKILETKPT